ncbi:large conductance mechanosensitive channel protein MscL [Longibacter salinarum]|uniref:Large-conductance mechanosensitive channel n=1 Tax=Longibacter salinarum TaxID=1850348 RepID=A0A2A8CXD4_9BACT|nr:large conductance mechanosensitive channel protein MscL [Longibacter salinarum]PEN13048.1 large conductance mechanosensitive channel protein MscL [Longibacter salinarum]
MLQEYKKFALRGNVVDMAVGIIIGAAFNGVVQSLVKDVITPPLGLLVGNVDFSNIFVVLKDGTTPGPYPTLEAANAAGAVTVNGGVFLNSAISFLIVSFAVFVLVRSVNKMMEPDEAPEPAAPTVKKCPFCVQDIPVQATRCPHCTSDITDEPSPHAAS